MTAITKITPASIDETGNYTVNTLTATSNVTASNANLGNLVTGNFFTGNGSLLSSITAGNVTGQVANALIAGTVYTNAQPNITSVGTLTSLTVTGLITATGTGIRTSNVQDSTGTLTIETKYGNIAGDAGIYGNLTIGTSGTGNVTAYNANLGNLVIGNFIQGTLTTSSQPNITSTGTLANLTVSGNASFTGANVYVSNVANLKIPGGTANYVLATDGASNLSWVAQTGGGGGGGLTFTAANTPPGSPNLGDQWYNTSTSVLYEYISDGGNFWIDIQTPTTTGASSSTYVSRTYTANGTGTTFTVTSGSNVNNLLVFLNGISQQPTVDYTVSGSTLTFDSAPANGTIVFIRELSTPQATTISQLIGNLTVTSNLIANGTVTLGSISNVKITGGSSGQVVQTDGTGNLSFSSPTTRAIAMTMGIIFGG